MISTAFYIGCTLQSEVAARAKEDEKNGKLYSRLLKFLHRVAGGRMASYKFIGLSQEVNGLSDMRAPELYSVNPIIGKIEQALILLGFPIALNTAPGSLPTGSEWQLPADLVALTQRVSNSFIV